MPDPLITETMRYFLKKKEFVYIATTSANGQPNVAPKFLIKTEGNFLYLADFVIGRTYENLKKDSRASLSIINLENLTGYQMNGPAEIIEHGEEFDELMADLHKREVHFSAGRIIERIQQDKQHQNYEIAFPERAVVFKVKVEEVVQIASSGKIKRSSDR